MISDNILITQIKRFGNDGRFYQFYFCIMKKTLGFLLWVLLTLACNSNVKSTKDISSWETDSAYMSQTYSPDLFKLDSVGLIDTILPFFAKLHDSIPYARRFDSVYTAYMQIHKKERQYKWLYYAKGKDSMDYFMISRLEPSIKSDKYSVLCARFKRLGSGQIDTSTFEELFWTWKMRMPELRKKSALLFKTYLEKGSVEAYLPENSEEAYIMFPDVRNKYDVKSKSWVSISPIQ